MVQRLLIFLSEIVLILSQNLNVRCCTLKFREPILDKSILSESTRFGNLTLILLQHFLVVNKPIHDPGFQCPQIHLIDLVFHHWNSDHSIAFSHHSYLFSIENSRCLYHRPQQPLHSFKYTIS